MNSLLPPSFKRSRGAWIAAISLLSCRVALAGTNSAAAQPAKTATAKNETAATIQIPKSEFAEGRDPFFPLRSGGVTLPDTTTPHPTAVLPTLQGISGQFALINGRTLKLGEEADVTINRNKVHIRLLKMSSDSVVVEVEGQSMELRLKPGL
jgi:hypothetical protein